jgi:diguanylate cyclase (GGDEF)-like protein
MDSTIGLIIQCAGISLVALLSFFMTRSIRRLSLEYWTIAWLCLSIALVVLYLGFTVPALSAVLYPMYLFGEYAFGYLFVVGCRNYTTGARIGRRDYAVLGAAAAFAVGLSRVSSNFNILFGIHAGIVAALFGVAILMMRRRDKRRRSGPGVKVMYAALVLLTLDFFHYVPVFTYQILTNAVLPLPAAYLHYTSIYDLILETLLGFGTIMVVMEDIHCELEGTNAELIAARDKLEVLASMDPLTGTLNRHAFLRFMARSANKLSGWAAIVDLDNLKTINDSLGHGAGDAAICEVARAIRAAIRPDDQLYRWGGDEFLILMFGIPGAEARGRIEGLNQRLAEVSLPGSSEPVAINVSYGLSQFVEAAAVEWAIESADRAMYACKLERREFSASGSAMAPHPATYSHSAPRNVQTRQSTRLHSVKMGVQAARSQSGS